jgi:MtrB/PioB family decaheme-associated outer membrane protein
MRTNSFVQTLLIAGCLFAWTSPVEAQPATPAPATPGLADFGMRASSVTGDDARFQRFRDVRDGIFLERFRWETDGNAWNARLTADHVGWRDQRYSAELRAAGKLKLSFQWDQVPLFVSGDTRTPFTADGAGVLRLPDSMQLAVQNGQARLADVAQLASPFEIRSRRDIARVALIYSATQDIDVKVNVRSTRREGTMPWGATFGHSNYVEVAAPIDTRTTDASGGLEWTGRKASVRVGYDGSWFDNAVPALTWDNPLRLTDLTTAGGQGRFALWPGSHTHGLTTAVSAALPARTRVTANVTVGQWRQNEPLLPATINSAITPIALPRPTADGEARTLAMNYTLTSRPTRYVWLNARFRYYDFDNRTPPFKADQRVSLDQSARPMLHASSPYGSTRQNLDLDTSLTPIPFTAIRLGYSRSTDDRTFRIFETTTEDVVRASIDSVANGRITVRAIFERGTRTGSGFDLQALTDVNEQPAMRHYDVADRDRQRVTGLVQLTPIPQVGVSATAAVGKDDYKNSGFGLRDNRNRALTMNVDVTPLETVAGGLSYGYDKYSALQGSRSAAPGVQFVDPTRDWTLDHADRVHTLGLTLDFLQSIPRTDVRLAYGLSRSRAVYEYGLAPNSPLAALQPLPPVTNKLQNATADLRYFLTEKLALGVVYWYDYYEVDDFALRPTTMDRLDLPGSLYLGYVYRPYRVHSAWARVTYLW